MFSLSGNGSANEKLLRLSQWEITTLQNPVSSKEVFVYNIPAELPFSSIKERSSSSFFGLECGSALDHVPNYIFVVVYNSTYFAGEISGSPFVWNK